MFHTFDIHIVIKNRWIQLKCLVCYISYINFFLHVDLIPLTSEFIYYGNFKSFRILRKIRAFCVETSFLPYVVDKYMLNSRPNHNAKSTSTVATGAACRLDLSVQNLTPLLIVFSANPTLISE